jgi:PA domain/Secretion system C-terminal sorting domain
MRVLLLMMTVLISVFARSQAVFEIETPASIKGFYKFGLSDSTIDYRWGNGNTGNKSVSAFLALGKDSLAREALELNVKGKIAVLYRGGASFTDIALRAQAAGAVAAIVINNRPLTDAAQGGAWPMAVSAGSENVKIPFIMISQEDGALISNQLRKGEAVKGYIGKKRKLDFDIKLTEDWIGTPLYRTRPVYLAKKGMISDTLGLSVINTGNTYGKNIIVVADISFGGKSIYADTLMEDSLAASGDVNGRDTMYYRFTKPFQPNFDLPTGSYKLKYSLRQLAINGQDTSVVTLNDDFKDDNEVEAYFTISDSTLAIGNIISYTSSANNNTVYTNKGNWSTASNTGANLKNFKQCIVFKNQNSDKVNINSMDFLGYSFETNGNLQNSKVGVEVYRWKPAATNIFDPNYKLTIDDLTPEVESEYVFKNAFKSDYGTYNFKNDGLTLEANGMYLFCVSTTTPSIGFGFNSKYEPNMWPSIAFNNQYLMPLYSDGTFYRTGFGSDMIPAITLNFSEKAVKSSSKDIISYSIVNPAIQASVGVDKVTFTVPNNTDITKLVAKFKLSPKATMTINNVKQVSDTTVNNYSTILNAVITAEDGSTKTYDIVITVAPKSSEKIIVSCKQGTAFGLIESDKVTFNLPTGTDVTKLVFTYTVSPLAKAYIFDSLGADKDSIFTTDVTKVNASGAVKIKVVAEDGSFKYYDLIVKVVKSSSKLITAFSFTTPAATATIKDGVISLSVPKGTDVTNLIAKFTASAKSTVFVGETPQVSGTTPNNFSDTVSYKVVAEDGSFVVYKVFVTVLKSTGNSITKFSFEDPAVTGVITGTNILVKVPKATDFTTLVASFEASTDAVVKIGANVQISGVTSNDFTNPISYDVTSESGVTKTYKVTVEEMTESNLCNIVSFGFESPKATGVVSGNKVTVTVPKGTDLTKLVASFTLSAGATAKVDTVKQVSGVTANDFTGVVKYDITAADNYNKKSFEVTVKEDASASLSELANSNIKLYPNPSTGEFKLAVSAGQLSVRIMDAAGREVYNFNDKNSLTNEFSVNLVGVENGTYFADVLNNGDRAVIKVQIAK